MSSLGYLFYYRDDNVRELLRKQRNDPQYSQYSVDAYDLLWILSQVADEFLN
jgi:hypothetical protein